MCIFGGGGGGAVAQAQAATPLRQPSRSPYPDVFTAGQLAGDALRKKMALAGTILTSPAGVTAPAFTAGQSLLGS